MSTKFTIPQNIPANTPQIGDTQNRKLEANFVMIKYYLVLLLIFVLVLHNFYSKKLTLK